MLRRILFSMMLLTQAVGIASVLTYEPIPICWPCPDEAR